MDKVPVPFQSKKKGKKGHNIGIHTKQKFKQKFGIAVVENENLIWVFYIGVESNKFEVDWRQSGLHKVLLNPWIFRKPSLYLGLSINIRLLAAMMFYFQCSFDIVIINLGINNYFN
ncbi:uncharacterized protein [Rutidosis leptorrhynchoides]|uniref:uncharacterized protein n=1 Tax=Rutidosis leptorrhynchoides TaxID=125765 RepID=UPI003A98EB7F